MDNKDYNKEDNRTDFSSEKLSANAEGSVSSADRAYRLLRQYGVREKVARKIVY